MNELQRELEQYIIILSKFRYYFHYYYNILQ